MFLQVNKINFFLLSPYLTLTFCGQNLGSDRIRKTTETIIGCRIYKDKQMTLMCLTQRQNKHAYFYHTNNSPPLLALNYRINTPTTDEKIKSQSLYLSRSSTTFFVVLLLISFCTDLSPVGSTERSVKIDQLRLSKQNQAPLSFTRT